MRGGDLAGRAADQENERRRGDRKQPLGISGSTQDSLARTLEQIEQEMKGSHGKPPLEKALFVFEGRAHRGSYFRPGGFPCSARRRGLSTRRTCAAAREEAMRKTSQVATTRPRKERRRRR